MNGKDKRVKKRPTVWLNDGSSGKHTEQSDAFDLVCEEKQSKEGVEAR
jgi:hypothetical protein